MKKLIIFLVWFLSWGVLQNKVYAQTIPTANIYVIPNVSVFKPGQSIVFDGSKSSVSGSGYILSYIWEVNGTFVAQGSNLTSYTTSFSLSSGQNKKTEQVELIVQSNTGQTASTTVTVTIHRQQRFYYLTDNLGSIRVTVNRSGTAVGYNDYYPFGKRMPGRSLNTSNPHDAYKFTGKELDQEDNIDLAYFGARYYDPELGRWMSVDPKAVLHPGLNPYNYTMNNPLKYTDLTGMSPDSSKHVENKLNNKTITHISTTVRGAGLSAGALGHSLVNKDLWNAGVNMDWNPFKWDVPVSGVSESALNGFRILSDVSTYAFTINVLYSGFKSGYYAINGNYRGAAKNGLDATMGTIGYVGGPIGLTISITYFGVKYTVGWNNELHSINNITIQNRAVLGPGWNMYHTAGD